MKEPRFDLMDDYLPGDNLYYVRRVVSGTKYVDYMIYDARYELTKEQMEKIGYKLEMSIVNIL